eukprot:5608017-Pyramimonas_sp.AAC.1
MRRRQARLRTRLKVNNTRGVFKACCTYSTRGARTSKTRTYLQNHVVASGQRPRPPRDADGDGRANHGHPHLRLIGQRVRQRRVRNFGHVHHKVVGPPRDQQLLRDHQGGGGGGGGINPREAARLP